MVTGPCVYGWKVVERPSFNTKITIVPNVYAADSIWTADITGEVSSPVNAMFAFPSRHTNRRFYISRSA